MITTNDLKNGYVLDIDGELVSVVQFQHVKPGKGGAFVRTKLKSLTSGAVVEKTFRAGEKVERVTTESRTMQFLYRDGEELHLMDNSTYEQLSVPASTVENDDLLAPNTDVQVLLRAGPPAPRGAAHVRRAGRHRTDPGVKGDTVSNVTKPAQLETGATDRRARCSSTRATACASTPAPASTPPEREARRVAWPGPAKGDP